MNISIFLKQVTSLASWGCWSFANVR